MAAKLGTMGLISGRNSCDEKGPPNKNYFAKSSKVLGKGAFKTVYKGIDLRSGREVAWGAVNVSRLGDYQTKTLLREVSIQRELKYQYLMPLLSKWINRQKGEAVIITPLATPLRSFIEQWQGVVGLEPVRRWLTQLLQALCYLHTSVPQVIHRDLKVDNVLLSPSGDVWLGDYGLARKVNETLSQDPQMTKLVGTPAFMAPELFQGEEGYNEKVDIYAFGMTMIEILTGHSPYRKAKGNVCNIYPLVFAGKLPPEIDIVRSACARGMIRSCLQKDPKLHRIRGSCSCTPSCVKRRKIACTRICHSTSMHLNTRILSCSARSTG